MWWTFRGKTSIFKRVVWFQLFLAFNLWWKYFWNHYISSSKKEKINSLGSCDTLLTYFWLRTFTEHWQIVMDQDLFCVYVCAGCVWPCWPMPAGMWTLLMRVCGCACSIQLSIIISLMIFVIQESFSKSVLSWVLSVHLVAAFRYLNFSWIGRNFSTLQSMTFGGSGGSITPMNWRLSGEKWTSTRGSKTRSGAIYKNAQKQAQTTK